MAVKLLDWGTNTGLVGNHNMTGIFAVNGDMDNRALMVAGLPFCTDYVHQFAVSGIDCFPVHNRFDTVSCDIFDIRNSRFIGRAVVRHAERLRNRVVKIAASNTAPITTIGI